MTDDGNAPTIPEEPRVQSSPALPKPPDARYSLRVMLGRGGMGEVWLAHDLRIDRDVAVKLMRGGSTDDPDAIARFLREARVQGRLEHPSVVPVHDLGGEDSSPFFAMKRLTGTTLADVIASHDQVKWPRRVLLARFIDVCLAIEFAHKRGVIHRDLKPANLMLGDYGEAYVLDWGLARISDDSDSGVIRHSDLRGDSGVGHTEAGAMLGTPGYMAPEQMRGEAIDPRADVFALGCILFEILAGAPAIPRERTFELTLSARCYRPAERNADVPPELDEACARATLGDVDKRTASARELADEVQRFLDGDRDVERRRELAAVHATRAQQLLAKPGNQARAEAMREAGSAIALDAGNHDAKQVLARLLLEPPAEPPPQVVAQIDRERQLAARSMIAYGRWIYLLFCLPLPVLRLIGINKTWPLVLVGGMSGLITIICTLAVSRQWRVGPALALLIVGMHCALLAIIGVVLGPLLLVPILVFGTSGMFGTVSAVNFPKTNVLLHFATFAVPLALEWLGMLPASYHFSGNALVLQPYFVDVNPPAVLVMILSCIILQLVANAFVFEGQRKLQGNAQEQLHVQKWQLEQLVPSSGSPSR